METEESLLLENSPLHKYLLQVQMDDQISTNDLCVPQEENNAKTDSALMANPASSKSGYMLQKWVCDKVALDNTDNLDLYYGYRVLDIVLRSNILEEEDAQHLSACKAAYSVDSTRTIRNYPHALRLVALLGFALAYLLSRLLCMHSDDISEYAAHYSWPIRVVDVCLTVSILLHVSHFWLFTRRQAIHRRNMECLRKMLKLNQEMDEQMKKAVVFLREREVLRHGYVMTTSSKVRDGVSHALSEVGGHIPDKNLRQAVFDSSYSILMLFRDAMEDLLKKYPLDTRLLPETLYLANVPLEHYGALFSPELDLSERLSGTALRAACQLYSLQRSEYLSYMCLALCPCFYAKDSSHSYENLVQILPTTLWNMSETCASHFVRVQKLVAAHDAINEFSANGNDTSLVPSTQSLPSKAAVKRRPGVKDTSSVSDSFHQQLCVATHSLSLHLQLALERSRELEGRLQAETHSSSVDEDIVAYMSDSLSLLESQLSACATCVEQARFATQTSAEPGGAVNPDEQKLLDIHQPVRIIEESEQPQICDQVFEGEVTEHDLRERSLSRSKSCTELDGMCVAVKKVLNSARGLSDGAQSVTQQDRRRKKAEAKFLLNELKAVLHERSKEMSHRERKALAQQRGVPIEEIEQEEMSAAVKPTSNLQCTTAADNQESEQVTYRQADFQFSGSLTLSQLIAAKAREFAVKVDTIGQIDDGTDETQPN